MLSAALVLLLAVAGAAATTREEWGSQVLSALGAPQTHGNLAVFIGWAQAEGSPCHYNPLDTTEGAEGATDCNSVGVKNYPSEASGVQATVDTLNIPDYSAIVSGLKRGESAVTIAQAIANSPWGTGQLAVTCIKQCVDSESTFQSWGNKPVVS